jgi:hypothetical protein
MPKCWHNSQIFTHTYYAQNYAGIIYLSLFAIEQ